MKYRFSSLAGRNRCYSQSSVSSKFPLFEWVVLFPFFGSFLTCMCWSAFRRMLKENSANLWSSFSVQLSLCCYSTFQILATVIYSDFSLAPQLWSQPAIAWLLFLCHGLGTHSFFFFAFFSDFWGLLSFVSSCLMSWRALFHIVYL